jgi:hypothetical protein
MIATPEARRAGLVLEWDALDVVIAARPRVKV